MMLGGNRLFAYRLLGCALLVSSVASVSAETRSTQAASPTWIFGDKTLDPARALNALMLGVTADVDEDQTEAITGAIEEVASREDVDTLYLPAGTYFVAGHLRPQPGVNLVGDGIGRTILQRRDESHYLLWGKHADYDGLIIALLTLDNDRRTVMLQNTRNLRFERVEFRGGIVRMEGGADTVFEANVFRDNLGKAGYASSDCDNIHLIHNEFLGIENGGINLSGHRDCYVAHNHITAERSIDSGYAGIRLPNSATRNVIEHNVIENHGRGLFVLTSSTGNVLRHNTIRDTTYQGIFIESQDNTIEYNTIIDAGDEAIYVVDGVVAGTETRQRADGTRVVGNTIFDTHRHDDERFVGLKILSANNLVQDNVVSSRFGRDFKQIKPDANNRDIDNIYLRFVEVPQSSSKEEPR